MPPPTSTSRVRWHSKQRRREECPAALLPLDSETWAAYRAHLDAHPGDTCALSLSAIGGCLGIREDILERAARIASTFCRVCASIHARCAKEKALRERLLEPLHALPMLRRRVAAAPFGLDFFRMDFFVNLETHALHIVEVNSGGAGLNDFLHCIEFLRHHFSFVSPPGFHSLDASGALHALLEHAPHIRTLGLVPVENGSTDYIGEYLHFARWLQQHTAIRPVFLELTKGELRLLEHPEVPAPIDHIEELDAILCDWFEDLPCLERVEHVLATHDILAIPPRSDLLFENKGFLPLLRSLPCPEDVEPADWRLLQSAILPSFPLGEFHEHLAEMRSWNGIVWKMDLDCGSENVHIADFRTMTFEDAILMLERTALESQSSGATWTVQAFIPPPRITLASPAPWLPDYSRHKFDLMTYFASVDGRPHVLFGSRGFSREKIDELTDEGRADGFLSPVCILPP